MDFAICYVSENVIMCVVCVVKEYMHVSV
jgi:hypothetical protein